MITLRVVLVVVTMATTALGMLIRRNPIIVTRMVLRMSSATGTRDTIANFAERTLEVNKSKFIARIYPVQSADEALQHVTDNQKSDPKASHWCWAFSVGGINRSSDDGEPSGTAGRPILSAIEGEELDSVVAVVVRYYGGTKLGTGGLVRAYGGSAREALRAAERVVRVEHATISITLPSEYIATVYQTVSKFEASLTSQKGVSFSRLSEEYADDGLSATLMWSVPRSIVEDIRFSLKEQTKGVSSVCEQGEED